MRGVLQAVVGVLEVNHDGEMSSDYINGLCMTRYLLKISHGPECPNISTAWMRFNFSLGTFASKLSSHRGQLALAGIRFVLFAGEDE